MQNKKQIQSIRTCIYSNKEYNKQELVRLVRVNNKIVIDTKHNLPGRGYYLKVTDQVLKDSKLIQILSKRLHCNINEEFIKQLKK